jgi:hypothetical protein
MGYLQTMLFVPKKDLANFCLNVFLSNFAMQQCPTLQRFHAMLATSHGTLTLSLKFAVRITWTRRRFPPAFDRRLGQTHQQQTFDMISRVHFSI